LDFYDEICFSDNKIIEPKLTLFYNQIQLQTFYPSYYSVLVTNFSYIVLFSVGDKLFIHRTIQCWWQTVHPSYYSVLVTNCSYIVHRTIQCWWQTFHTSYYSVLVTNFSSIVLFSVGDKLFIHRTIQCWWQTFHPSYYAVLVANFASIIIGYGDNILSHNFLVPRIRYRSFWQSWCDLISRYVMLSSANSLSLLYVRYSGKSFV
jgi:aryl carrier-like protein